MPLPIAVAGAPRAHSFHGLARGARAALCLAAVAAACRDGSAGPNAPVGEPVLVVGGDATTLAVVDGTTGRVASRAGPVGRAKLAMAQSADGATVYLATLPDGASKALLALDARTGRRRWSVDLYDPRDRRRTDGYALFGAALAATPDGARLAVGEAYAGADDATFGQPGNETGLALLDVDTRKVVRFAKPLRVVEGGGLATLPPGPAAPAGALLAIGTRDPWGTSPSLDRLFVLDPVTLDVLDSATVTDPEPSAKGTLRQVVPAPDGRSVYLVGRGRYSAIVKYDLVASAVVATAPIASAGWLTVAPDGGALYLPDPGDGRDDPGTGTVFVFGPDLEARPPLDLRAASVGGVPPVTHAAAVSRDGARLYVTAGTPYYGPLYGIQPLRLLVVDRATGALLHDVPAGGYGSAIPVVP